MLALLLTACSNTQIPANQQARHGQQTPAAGKHTATAAVPVSGPTATLTYTATNMKHGLQGTAVGKSALHFYTKPAFCAPRTAHKNTMRQVSEAQPEVTVTIPADQPLVIETFWSGPTRHCLLGNRAFRAKPGVHYRMTTRVNAETGGCVLWVQKQTTTGKLVDLGQLQTLKQICAAKR